MDEWDLDGLRDRSAALFGSEHRLVVAVYAAVAEPEQLYAGWIARQARISRKEAGKHLRKLQAADVLERVERTPPADRGRGQPPDYLWRRDDRFWEGVLALGERFRRAPPRLRRP